MSNAYAHEPIDYIREQIISIFTDWDFGYTGAGDYVIIKDFANNKGRPVMVTMTSDFIVLLRNKDNQKIFIDSDEYYDNQKTYLENSDNLMVCLFSHKNKIMTINPIMKDVFPPSVRESMFEAHRKLSELTGKIVRK